MRGGRVNTNKSPAARAEKCPQQGREYLLGAPRSSEEGGLELDWGSNHPRNRMAHRNRGSCSGLLGSILGTHTGPRGRILVASLSLLNVLGAGSMGMDSYRYGIQLSA